MAKPAVRELIAYLERKFSADDLHRLVDEIDDAEDLARGITWDQPILRLTRDVVGALERYDLLDEGFFTTLVRIRPRQEAEILRIAEKIGRLPQKATPPRPEPIPEPARTTPIPYVVPFASKGAGLVGRDRALDDVRTRLLRPTRLTSAVAFTGVGGLGKTQLAAEYAHRWQAEYPGGLFWLTMDAELAPQLQRLVEDAGWVHPNAEPVSKIAEARIRLPSLDHALIVLDNVEEAADVIELLPAGARSHVIITSREPLDLPRFRQEIVAVRPLEADDTWLLLERESRRPLEARRDEPWVARFLEQLDGLPLAIELAGAYLRANEGIGVEDYAELLDRAGLDADVLSDPTVVNASTTGHDADLRAALRVSTRLLEGNAQLSAVLEVLAWSGPTAMGRPLLARVLAVEETDLVGALGLGERLQLLRLEGNRRYRLHRLVRLVLREQLVMELETDHDRAKRLEAWFTERREEFGNLPMFEAEHDHLDAWQRRAEERGWWREAAALAWLQGYPPFHWGRMVEAYQSVARAVALMPRVAVADPLLEGRILTDMGTCESFCGTNSRAEDYVQRALGRLRRLAGANRDLARVAGNAAIDRASSGSLEDATAYAQEARVAAEDLPPGDLVRAEAARAMAHVLRSGEHRDDALRVCQSALQELVPLLGENHQSVLNLRVQEAKAVLGSDNALSLAHAVRAQQVMVSPHDLLRLGSIEILLGELHKGAAEATVDTDRTALVEHLDAAVRHYRSAATLGAKATGSRSESVASVRYHLADAQWSLGEETGNPRHHQDAIEAVEAGLRECPRSTSTYANLQSMRSAFRRAKIPGVRFSSSDR
ncbi:MAG: NB-ARC domain-containing protein [Myxococcota bacterium]